MKINNLAKLIIAIAISELAGIIGSVFTIPSIPTWYATLTKPAINPPAWIFAPVWTILYLLMGTAVWFVWKKMDSRRSLSRTLTRDRNDKEKRGDDRKIKIALGIFGGQLALNALWSIIFFGLHNPGLAFVNIIALWLAILWTIVIFYRISPSSSSIWTTEGHGKLAAWLLVPYILWVSFAAYLNYAIWILN